VPPNLSDQIDLSQKRIEDGNPSEESHRPFGVTQNYPLARQQSGDLPRNNFVRGLGIYLSVVSRLTGRADPNFGIQAESTGMGERLWHSADGMGCWRRVHSCGRK
jgi:hypothetical protein